MGGKVLVLEDEPFSVESFAKLLNEDGEFAVTVVSEVREAVEKLSSEEYDVFVLDIMLPHDDLIAASVPPKETGVALVKQLRGGRIGDYNVSHNMAIPLAVLTAIANPTLLAAIRGLEPVVLLRKPIGWASFTAALNSATRGTKALGCMKTELGEGTPASGGQG